MKRILTLIFIVSMLMAGCNKSIDNTLNESVSDSTEASAVVAEAAPPESIAAETSEAIADEKPQFEHDWQMLYYDELLEVIDSPDSPDVMFNIYDLDGDGTPELLLSEGPYHAAGCALVTVYQGELVRLGLYGGWGEFQYDFERNYIHSSYFQMGSGWLDIYSFENGEAPKIVSLYSYNGSFPDSLEEYKINDEEVPEDVFNAEYEKYSFDIREDFIVRKYDVTQSVIEGVLRECKHDASNIITVPMVNIARSISPFDMGRNDTVHGWTLSKMDPYEINPDGCYYGFLTFTGEVTLTGTIRHVLTIYDGFEFVPDEESKEKILVLSDNDPEREFFLCIYIMSGDDPSVPESLSELAVDESGAYTIVLTEYSLAHVQYGPVVNGAVVSSIKKQ